jgi:peroxiredoxin
MRAVAVAIVLGAWPACNRNAGPPETANLDFVLKDVNGADVRLGDFQGKPLLINFWATWCGPCRAEMPWFTEFSEKYKAEGLIVLGISTDDGPDEIKRFAADHEITYQLLVGKDQVELLKAFEAEMVIPVSWIIRPDGIVAAKAVGIHEKSWFERQIQALF